MQIQDTDSIVETQKSRKWPVDFCCSFLCEFRDSYYTIYLEIPMANDNNNNKDDDAFENYSSMVSFSLTLSNANISYRIKNESE